MELNAETIVKLSWDETASDIAAEVLNFSDKNITQIAPDVFNQYNSLRILFLSGNKIVNIPPNVFHSLENLEEIYLNGNQIRELDASIFSRNENLKKIYLHNNAIEVIAPTTFANLKYLDDLWLEHNQIVQLPGILFHSNTELTRIDLSNNSIEELHPNIFSGNQKLKEIRISKNKIKSLHSDTFRQLSELKVLHIYDNLLQTCNFNNLKDSTKLRKIWIDNDELEQFYDIHTFWSLFPNLKIERVRQPYHLDDFQIARHTLAMLEKSIDGLSRSRKSRARAKVLPDAEPLQQRNEISGPRNTEMELLQDIQNDNVEFRNRLDQMEVENDMTIDLIQDLILKNNELETTVAIFNNEIACQKQNAAEKEAITTGAQDTTQPSDNPLKETATDILGE